MLIETSIINDIKVLRVFGSINFDNYQEFEHSLLRNTDNSKLLLDLENLNYINSMALNSIVKVYLEMKKKNNLLVLCSLKDNIKKLFKITKLEDVISIFENESSAIKYLQE